MGVIHRATEDCVDEHALLVMLQAQVPEDVLRTLVDTEEILWPDDATHVSAVLHRFLAADKFDVNKALRRLAVHADWRREAIPPGGILEETVQNQLKQQKAFIQPRGIDGRPVVVVKIANHHVTTPEEVDAFVIFCLEAASKLCDLPGSNPDCKLWVIMDARDVKWANMDRHALSACFALLSRHFPERVKKIFMLDSPLIFSALYKVVSPFIDPVTKQKIAFVTGSEALLKELDPKVVPVQYGGTAEGRPVEVAVRELRREIASIRSHAS